MFIFQNPKTKIISTFNNLSEVGMGFIDWVNITDTEEGKIYLLQKAKNEKLAKLNDFHASEEVKIFTIKLANGATTKISVDADTRYLLDEQISLLNLKKLQGEADPKWLYQNGIDMPLNYDNLVKIRLYIGDLVDANFKAKKIHEKEIANLKTIEEIEKYDLKIGYRLNQILSF
jgi:hypothetical protein